MILRAGDARQCVRHRFALDQEHARVTRFHDVGNVALREREALPVVGEGLEHHACVEIALAEHEDRAATHAVQGLADDFAVLAQEAGHLPHVARDQGRRAALREPGRVDLLVHVPQPLRAVDDEHTLALGALEDVGAVDVLGVKRRILAHQDAPQGAQGFDSRLPQGEPPGGVGPDRERSHAPERDAVAQQQIALFEVGERKAACLRREQHGQRRILRVADGADGIHHHAQSPESAHPVLPKP